MSKTAQRSRKLLAVGTALGVAFGLAPLAAHAEDAPAVPKNVIVLISDGGGYNQFDSASLFEKGVSKNQVTVDPKTGSVQHSAGVSSYSYQDWPVAVSQSHFSASGRGHYTPEEAWGSFDWVASGATDSAAAATALGTGVKTINGTIGFDPKKQRLLTVGEQAKAVGKGVGLVTSVPFNHATPAGFIAHNADRNDYQGLATEMIDSGADVLMGGGHPNFTDAHKSRAANYTWISQNDFTRLSEGKTDFNYIDDKASFENLAAGADVPDKVFGLAQVAETLQYNRPGLENNTVRPGTDARNDVPELATMAQGALNVLSKKDNGFFLMVEGGAVDWAGHANQTTRLVEEQQDFNKSVAAVESWVQQHSNWDETLVIVTADHETGYLTGPDGGKDKGWTPLTGKAGELPAVSWHSGGHTNSLVPFYAKGAGSNELAKRAVHWDSVRGAYLDNTDVGEVVFDALGHKTPATGASSVGVEASVSTSAPDSGALSLSVPVQTTNTELLAKDGSYTGALPELTVADTRSEVQARGKGWTLAGSASKFTAGNRTFNANALAWTPRIVSSEAGAAAGKGATLEAPASLADTDRTTRVGTTVVGADLNLTPPANAKSGRYGSEITLSLFPKD